MKTYTIYGISREEGRRDIVWSNTYSITCNDDEEAIKEADNYFDYFFTTPATNIIAIEATDGSYSAEIDIND